MEARIAAAEAKGRYLASSVDRSETTRDLAEALVQNRPPGSTCVIDEVWKYWPAGLKTSSVPVAEMAFWKEHRHSLDWRGEGGDVYLIDQALDSGVAKFIRDLVHRTLIVTKHDAVGMAKRFVVDVYKGPVAIDKRKPKALLSSYQGKFKPEIFAAYKSHTHDTRGNDTGLEAVEERVSVQHTVFGSMTFKAAAIAACMLPLLGWFVVNAWNGLADSAGAPKANLERAGLVPASKPQAEARQPEPNEEQAVVYGSSTPETGVTQLEDLRSRTGIQPPSPEPAEEDPFRLSPRWRVAGVVWRADMTGKVLLVSATGRRELSPSECEQDGSGNWYCPLDDGTATMWSGAGSASVGTRYSGAVAPGTTADHGYRLPGQVGT